MRRFITAALISLVLGSVAHAQVRIWELQEDTTPAASDMLAFGDGSASASPRTKRITFANLFSYPAITCTPPLLCNGGSAMNLAGGRTLSINTATFTAEGSIKRTVYNPRDYGSLGTANDTSVFQAAIDACAATGVGGTVIVPSGEWNVCGVRAKSECQLSGIGERSSKLWATSGCAEVLKLDSASVGWVTISNLWIEGNSGAAPSSIGILIDQDGAAYTGSGPIFLRNLMVTGTGSDGIKFRGSRSSRVLSTTVRGAGGHCFSFVPGASTTGVSDMILADTNAEGCLGDLVHCESCVQQLWSGFKGGGISGTDRGFFFDSNSHNNVASSASVDGLVTAAWYFDGPNNVCMGCNSYDAATSTSPAVVFTANADNNIFSGFVKTSASSPITGYAVEVQSGATGNRINIARENMIVGGFVAGSDVTNNVLVDNGFQFVPATNRILCRASAGAGPQEYCTLGSGFSYSGTSLVGAFSGTGACSANQWASTLNQAAAPTCTQPGFSNLSGSATDSQVPDNITISAISAADITLKQSASPTPTAEGRIEWDTDDDALAVGNGSSTWILDDAGFSTSCGAVTNVAAVTNRSGQYNRNNKTVTFSGACDIDPTTGGILTVFFVNLPVASNLALLGDLGGAGGFNVTGVALSCQADSANDRAQCAYTSDAGAASQTANFVIQYQIK